MLGPWGALKQGAGGTGHGSTRPISAQPPAAAPGVQPGGPDDLHGGAEGNGQAGRVHHRTLAGSSNCCEGATFQAAVLYKNVRPDISTKGNLFEFM